MDTASLLEELKKHQDLEYKQFHSSLGVNTDLIGVRTPILEQIAKTLAKENPIYFLDQYQKTCYETDVIYGFIVGYAKLDYAQKVHYFDKFTSLVDNWATCDLVCARQKWIKKKENKDCFLSYLSKLWNSKDPWKQRIVYVLLLDHYLEETYLPTLFQYCDMPYEKSYYVQMAIAWLLSVMLIHFPDQTELYLHKSKIDTFTFNKTLQKARESTRISKEKKAYYQTLKRE